MTHDNGAYVKPMERPIDAYRFEDYPTDKQAIFTCSICGAPCTFLTRLHARAHACTGCMLRTLRPYDYTRAK